jgi:hypothetical protein
MSVRRRGPAAEEGLSSRTSEASVGIYSLYLVIGSAE